MRKWFIVLSIALLIPLLSGCDYRPVIQPAATPTTRPATTLADLQQQIITQMHVQWPAEKFESVDIVSFERSTTPEAFNAFLRINWDATHSTGTNVNLIPAAQRYYLGTLRVEGKPLPVNFVLAFE